MSGKGSKQRPQSVDSETFASNWDQIFGTHDKCGTPDCCGMCDTATSVPKIKAQANEKTTSDNGSIADSNK